MLTLFPLYFHTFSTVFVQTSCERFRQFSFFIFYPFSKWWFKRFRTPKRKAVLVFEAVNKPLDKNQPSGSIVLFQFSYVIKITILAPFCLEWSEFYLFSDIFFLFLKRRLKWDMTSQLVPLKMLDLYTAQSWTLLFLLLFCLKVKTFSVTILLKEKEKNI